MFKPVTPNVNFPEMEKKILEGWYSSGLVDRYLHRNDKSEKRFSFLDGPITANNPMGVHHAWGRTYKDLWQRFHNMLGDKQRFQNGFDCQGLWIEVEVEKELEIRNKKDIENLVAGDKKKSIAKFVQLCKDRVVRFSNIQTEQSKRLGYFMDWDNSYYTMSDENNYMIWHFLKTCHEKGWIYKGRDSVPWCPRCQTAISQHEMLTEDYKEIVHESIYFRLPIVGRENEYLLVWTTTPWTIPANIAVAVDVTFNYSLVEASDGKKYWLARELIESVFGTNAKKIIKTVKGKELVGAKYHGPFDDLEVVKKTNEENKGKFHIVIPTDKNILPIVLTEGTGIVHTAVSAGVEDFKLGKKLGLPMIAVIEDNADYLPTLGFLAGQNAKKHPRIILDYVAQKGFAYKIHNYKHRYPACWRCKAELVWKVADEWYIAMDKKAKSEIPASTMGRRNPKSETKNGKTLRKMMMGVAKKINWIPDFGLDRELDWLKNMHDWLISKKNRYWGLALPIYECTKCGWFDVLGSKEELKERAVEGWKEFEGHTPHKPHIDEVKIKCAKCDTEISRIDDVGNVWLDAGIVPFATYLDPKTKKLSYTSDKKYWGEWYPVDFITESFPGQFKNWFYSMIAMSTVLENENPFKTVLGFATLLGEDGRPMHKSWGNAIEFNEGADKIGVDVIRWMFAKQDPEQNSLFGYKKADETRRKFHLLLWNIYNFFITYANTDQYKVEREKSKITNVLDEWILSKLNELIQKVTESLDKFDAAVAANSLELFVSDLSQWYVRRSRDRVGPTVPNSQDKENCYKTLYEVLTTLCRLLAPFTPYISEEIYQNLTGEESVHLANWPAFVPLNGTSTGQTQLMKNMEFIRQVCELGHAKRKELGLKVRQPLGKFSIFNFPRPRQAKRGGQFSLNDEMTQLIKDELNVKEVETVIGDGEIEVELDTQLTPTLIAEGQARELVRQIQNARKSVGCGLTDKIKVNLPSWPIEFTNYIKKETLADELIVGDIFKIEIK